LEDGIAEQSPAYPPNILVANGIPVTTPRVDFTPCVDQRRASRGSMHHRAVRRFVSCLFFLSWKGKKNGREGGNEVIHGFSQSDLSTLGFLRNYRPAASVFTSTLDSRRRSLALPRRVENGKGVGRETRHGSHCGC